MENIETLENELKQLFIDEFDSLPQINNSTIQAEDIFNRWRITTMSIHPDDYVDCLKTRISQIKKD